MLLGVSFLIGSLILGYRSIMYPSENDTNAIDFRSKVAAAIGIVVGIMMIADALNN